MDAIAEQAGQVGSEIRSDGGKLAGAGRKKEWDELPYRGVIWGKRGLSRAHKAC